MAVYCQADMPFTLSHPAAVAPIRLVAGALPLSALAIGAMIPDFEYFWHLRPLALWSHSILGLFRFCLPLGLVTLALWELVMRGPTRTLLGLAPDPNADARRWRWWVSASIAILLGAATHLIWDGLTHRNRWAHDLFPSLGRPAFALGNGSMSWLGVLDYAGTLVGGVVVLVWLWRTLKHGNAFRAWRLDPWRFVVTSALVAAGLIGGVANMVQPIVTTRQGILAMELRVARLAVGAMLAFGVALLIYCLAAGKRRAASPQPPTRSESATSSSLSPRRSGR